MATSPPYAASPTGSNTPISRKRPSLSTQLSSKRRKPSSAGPSGLRQTSFPPEGQPPRHGSRSPSVDSTLAGTPSLISGVGAGGRKRKSKGGKDDGSLLGSGRGSRANGAGAGSAVVDEDGEDEEDDGDMQANLQGEESNEAEQQHQARALAVLLDSFDPEQTRLYNQYMGVGRNIGPKIRKLANHTLSQSVPSSVVVTIASYTKVFLGQVIELAREVQMEWQAAEDILPTGQVVAADALVKDRVKAENRGPLGPDHLREAVRRLRRDKVGGAAGFQGVSLTGKTMTAPKMGGRKLFR